MNKYQRQKNLIVKIEFSIKKIFEFVCACCELTKAVLENESQGLIMLSFLELYKNWIN